MFSASTASSATLGARGVSEGQHNHAQTNRIIHLSVALSLFSLSFISFCLSLSVSLSLSQPLDADVQDGRAAGVEKHHNHARKYTHTISLSLCLCLSLPLEQPLDADVQDGRAAGVEKQHHVDGAAVGPGDRVLGLDESEQRRECRGDGDLRAAR
jgi:hypothetical protein